VIKDRQQYQPEQSELEAFIGVTQFNGDNSAATGAVNASLFGDTPSPASGFIPRLRRRLSRQRSHPDDDSQQPYVRFENEPAVIRDSQNTAASSSSISRT